METAGDNPESRTQGDRAYEVIRAAIIHWDLEPGSQVSEMQLAERYGFGRAPIRRALARLCHEHMIDSVPRRGYIVAPITFAWIQDALGARLVVEPAIAKSLATWPDARVADTLEEINDGCRVDEGPYDSEAIREANHAFHMQLAIGTGNPRLVEIQRVLLSELERILYSRLVGRETGTVGSTYEEYRAIIAAIRACDPDAAEQAAYRHVKHNKDDLINVLTRSENVRMINLGNHTKS